MKPILKATAIATASISIALMTPAQSQAADNYFVLINEHSRKCLEIDNGSSSNGARAQQWSCNGQNSSKWRMVYLNNETTYFHLVNAESGKCLEIADSRTDNGAPAQQWECGNAQTMGWGWGHSDQGGMRIVNMNSSKDLEIENSSTSNGARAQLWGSWGSSGETAIWGWASTDG